MIKRAGRNQEVNRKKGFAPITQAHNGHEGDLYRTQYVTGAVSSLSTKGALENRITD